MEGQGGRARWKGEVEGQGGRARWKGKVPGDLTILVVGAGTVLELAYSGTNMVARTAGEAYACTLVNPSAEPGTVEVAPAPFEVCCAAPSCWPRLPRTGLWPAIDLLERSQRASCVESKQQCERGQALGIAATKRGKYKKKRGQVSEHKSKRATGWMIRPPPNSLVRGSSIAASLHTSTW